MTAPCKLFRKYIFPVNFVSSQKAWLLLCELCHCRKLFKDRVFLGGWGVPGSIITGYVPLPSQSPYPTGVYSLANDRANFDHFW